MSDLHTAATAACQQVGVIYQDTPADGKFHQLDVEGKSPRNGAGRIRLYTDGEGGQVWNFVTGDTLQFWAKSNQTFTPAEQEERNRRAKTERDQAEKELVEAREKAAEKAQEVVKAAAKPTDNPYLKLKLVESTATMREIMLETLEKIIGYRPQAKGKPFSGGKVLIVPVNDGTKITTIEMIDSNGLKAGLKDGQKKSCFWTSHPLPKTGTSEELTIGIGEGVATMLTYHIASGNTGIAALSCNNLIPVAKYVRNRYPAARIEIISDVGNGEQAATEAAGAIAGWLVKPTFSPGSSSSDINDLYKESGLEAVRDTIRAARQIEAAALVEPSPDAGIVAKSTADTWRDPLLFDAEMKPSPIPEKKVPAWLGDYCRAVSSSTQTPPGMAAMIGLSAIATCTQGRFDVYLGGSHRECLALWTVTGLPPGSIKTAVLNAFTGPFVEWEKERSEEMKGAIARNNQERASRKKRIEILTGIAGKESDPLQREVINREAAEIMAEMPEEMFQPKLWVGNVNAEGIQGAMAEQGGSMAVATDEGGVLEIMAGLYTDGKADMDVFLKGHDGSPLRIKRQSREVNLDRGFVTFAMCIQPDVIASLASGDKKRFKSNGTLARFLWCIPENTVSTRDVRKQEKIPDHIKQAYRDGIRRLLAISRTDTPRELTIDPEAKESWFSFAQAVVDRLGEHGELASIQEWAAKLPGQAARIAGLFHLVQHFDGKREIDNPTMEAALEISEALIDHAKTAFGLMGDDAATADAKAVLKWILSNVLPGENPHFKQSVCHTSMQGRFRTLDRLKAAMKVLIDRHILKEPHDQKTGGRPSIIYSVNPAIFNRKT